MLFRSLSLADRRPRSTAADLGGAKTVPARSAAVLRGRRSANVSPCLRYNDRLAGLGFSTSASDSIISGTEREATTQL